MAFTFGSGGRIFYDMGKLYEILISMSLNKVLLERSPGFLIVYGHFCATPEGGLRQRWPPSLSYLLFDSLDKVCQALLESEASFRCFSRQDG